jgi:hypothetical protein
MTYDENISNWNEPGRWVITPDGVGIITAGGIGDLNSVVHLTGEDGNDLEDESGQSIVREYAAADLRRALRVEIPEPRRPIE